MKMKRKNETDPLASWRTWSQFLLGDDVAFVQSNEQTRSWLFRSHFSCQQNKQTKTLENCRTMKKKTWVWDDLNEYLLWRWSQKP